MEGGSEEGPSTSWVELTSLELLEHFPLIVLSTHSNHKLGNTDKSTSTTVSLHTMSDKPVTDQAKDAAQGAKEGVAGEGNPWE